MFNLPNLLTILRVVLIPVFVGLFYYPTTKTNFMAACVFVIAALTDLLDGYLARKLKQTTKFGAFLDPVADKIMVCTALVLIVEYYSVHVNEFFPHMNLLVSIPAMVIIAREIVVSALREWMAEIGQRAQVAVNWVGKWKTAIQMTAIALLIYRYNEPMIYAAVGLLGVATVLTIWSMVVYLKAGLSHMSEDSMQAAPAVAKKDIADSALDDAASCSADDTSKSEALAERNEEVVAPSTEDAPLAANEEATAPSAEDAPLATNEEVAANSTEDAPLATNEEVAAPSTEDAPVATNEEVTTNTSENAPLATNEEATAPSTEDAPVAANKEVAAPSTEDAPVATNEEATTNTSENAPLATDKAVSKSKESIEPLKVDELK